MDNPPDSGPLIPSPSSSPFRCFTHAPNALIALIVALPLPIFFCFLVVYLFANPRPEPPSSQFPFSRIPCSDMGAPRDFFSRLSPPQAADDSVGHVACAWSFFPPDLKLLFLTDMSQPVRFFKQFSSRANLFSFFPPGSFPPFGGHRYRPALFGACFDSALLFGHLQASSPLLTPPPGFFPSSSPIRDGLFFFDSFPRRTSPDHSRASHAALFPRSNAPII